MTIARTAAMIAASTFMIASTGAGISSAATTSPHATTGTSTAARATTPTPKLPTDEPKQINSNIKIESSYSPIRVSATPKANTEFSVEIKYTGIPVDDELGADQIFATVHPVCAETGETAGLDTTSVKRTSESGVLKMEVNAYDLKQECKEYTFYERFSMNDKIIAEHAFGKTIKNPYYDARVAAMYSSLEAAAPAQSSGSEDAEGTDTTESSDASSSEPLPSVTGPSTSAEASTTPSQSAPSVSSQAPTSAPSQPKSSGSGRQMIASVPSGSHGDYGIDLFHR